MLTPEEARKVLDQHKIDDIKNQQNQLDRIKLLPVNLQKSAYALLRRDENGKLVNHAYYLESNDRDVDKKINRALWHIEKMDETDRTRILEIFFPKIASYVERGWNFQKSLPYQNGYMRKAFRAPNNARVSFWKRMGWLKNLIQRLSAYDEDLLWFTQYGSYINYGWGGDVLSPVLSAVMDSDDALSDEIFTILVSSANGEHEIGKMGRHIPRSLLSASRPEGWDFIERLLLAAQRQEGLRQSILETVDEAHPQAFLRMLHVILEHDLIRFSAVTRAVNVWFGFAEDSENQRAIVHILVTALKMLESPEIRSQALEAGAGEDVYLALWAVAFNDAEEAVTPASSILKDADIERRFAALHLLSLLDLPSARDAMMDSLSDDDLRMVSYTCQSFRYTTLPQPEGLFEIIEAVIERMPDKPRSLEPILWLWVGIVADKEVATGLLLKCLGERSPQRLIVHLGDFTPSDRVRAAKLLADSGMDNPEVRDAVIKIVGDRSGWVRESVIKIMAEQDIQPEDAVYLEGLLTRKANDLRRGLLNLLVKQVDADAIASADRLIEAKKSLQRRAGLELLQLLVEAERQTAECRQRAEAYQQTYPDRDDTENALLDRILEQDQADFTLENVLGLIDPAERTQPAMPQEHNVEIVTSAAINCLVSLDELIHEHRMTPLMTKTWQGEEQEVLLGNAPYAIPNPDVEKPMAEDVLNLPLRELWEGWHDSRPESHRDNDEMEMLRAWIDLSRQGYRSNLTDEGPKRLQMKYGATVERILVWLLRLYEPPAGADFVLDMLETEYAAVLAKLMNDKTGEGIYRHDWRNAWDTDYGVKLQHVRHYRHLSQRWTAPHHVRLFKLLRWLDEPKKGLHRHRPQLREVLWAYEQGAATEADLYDQLLGSRDVQGRYGGQFNDVRLLSSKRPDQLFGDYPRLQSIFEECRQRILEVELSRGELPTVVSGAAMSLRSIYGIEWYVRILGALGKDTLTRGYAYNSQNRSTVFSHLLRVSFPAENETLEDFADAVKKAGLTRIKLIESAVYAPQWANYVEFALRLEGFASAVWWIHAHTKDTNWYVDAEIRETWGAQVSERTPLSSADLLAGAVDVAWFWQVYETLGEQQWKEIHSASKYSSGGQGHTRAKLFADAMLEQLAKEELVNRLTNKRHQDSVRALGLLPLPEHERDAEILSRYQIIQEFVRGSRKFGSQRQESEKTAARIALENLARTAGFPDPLRLQWAMEAEEVADLKAGSISISIENVTLTLRIDEIGKPHLDVHKDGKQLKNIPAKMRKVEAFVALRERKTAIEKQYSRMRVALESAMCREDRFEVRELRELIRHPILAPLLEQLIFVTDDQSMGYLVDGAVALQNHDGRLQKLSDNATLRIAHPYALYQSLEWSEWQRECFLAERIQPFKQVFRELYVLTEAEKLDGAISRRYAGHQIQPRQALALFGSRGWISRPEEGVGRTFHKHKLAAYVTFLQGFYTPADVEGLTIEGVVFVEPGRWWQPLPLADIPPLIFSEVMRDMDLVVSVAHRGGVDPEATASTVDMRTALIRETCALLKINNVEIRGNHALIEGKLGSYSVHLGSAIVHRQPGGALCIIPVHAQHRGRIFLPFADDDPKTAEVISKVLLLAQDHQIKDPTILEQIYAGG